MELLRLTCWLSPVQTQRNPSRTSWMSPALRTVLSRRNRGGRGLISPASSSRSWKLPSRGTATLTWAPERRSQCGPTWRRHESGWVQHNWSFSVSLLLLTCRGPCRWWGRKARDWCVVQINESLTFYWYWAENSTKGRTRMEQVLMQTHHLHLHYAQLTPSLTDRLNGFSNNPPWSVGRNHLGPAEL